MLTTNLLSSFIKCCLLRAWDTNAVFGERKNSQKLIFQVVAGVNFYSNLGHGPLETIHDMHQDISLKAGQIFRDRVMKTAVLSLSHCSFGKQHNFLTSFPSGIGRPEIFIAVLNKLGTHHICCHVYDKQTINTGFECQAWIARRKMSPMHVTLKAGIKYK